MHFIETMLDPPIDFVLVPSNACSLQWTPDMNTWFSLSLENTRLYAPAAVAKYRLSRSKIFSKNKS
jgi:hypothetical protein